VETSHAKELASRFVAERFMPPDDDQFVLVDAASKETPEGWYFFFQSAKFLESRDMNYFFVGNWPIYVSHDGSIVEQRRPPLSHFPV